MSNPSPDMLEQRRATLRSLTGGGGGPTYDPMDARVERLESDAHELRAEMRSLRDAVGGVAQAVARMEGKLDAKVDYKWMTVYVLGIVAALLKDEIIALFR